MDSSDKASWIAGLSTKELSELASSSPFIASYQLDDRRLDEIGNMALPRAIDGTVLYASWPKYWEELKAEFRLLICTNNPKYRKLRRELNSATGKSQTAIVSAIAAAMAGQFGVIAGILVPFCALILMTIIRIGTQTFCSTMNPNRKRN